MNALLLASAALLSTAGCTHQRGLGDLAGSRDVTGPRHSRTDLYKPWPGADKLYVQIDLGDGTPRVMLLDSGAGVTLLTAPVAAALGLSLSPKPTEYLQVSGILRARNAVLPVLKLAGQTITNVQVAVPETPVHDQAGGVQIAGLLGANVLSHFVVVVDYPDNRLELYRAGTAPTPDRAVPLYFDGQHAMTGVIAVARRDGVTVKEQLLVDIDTGARGLWLFGDLSDDLAALASEGVEPVVGVSRADSMPSSSLLQTTRRIPIMSIEAGGTRIDRDVDATWTSFDTVLGAPSGTLSTTSPGLLGHAFLDGHRAVIDYPAQRFALLPPKKSRPEQDLNRWQLKLLRHSRAPDHLLSMARLQVWMGEAEDARRSLERHHSRHPEDAGGTVMLARMRRIEGKPDEAMQLLADLSPSALDEQGELDALVNSLWLRGQPELALDLAQQAVAVAPNSDGAWISLADAARAAGQLTTARDAVARATELAEDPDGYLLRRAWIAADEGDAFGALTHLRRQLELEPSGIITPWFYAPLAVEQGQVPLLINDLDRTRARLHPGEGGLDFLAAAYSRAGRDDLAHSLVEEGLSRDCQATEGAQRDNCMAWYHALIGDELDQARQWIAQALAEAPDSSEYLDTLAVISEAQGDLAAAAKASETAAILTPTDVYLLWQAARLRSSNQTAGMPESP